MKKVCLLLLVIALGNSRLSAFSLKNLTVGPEVGLNISNYYGQLSGEPISNLTVRGLRIGAVANYKLNKRFSLQTGLLYVANGFEPLKGDRIYSKELQVHTLQLPLMATAKINVRGGNTAFVGLGPYVAANVAGTTKISNKITLPYIAYENITRDLRVGSGEEDDLKMIDFGLCAQVGYLLTNGLYLKVHYQSGILNLLPGGDSQNSLRNYNFGFSAGYLLHIKERKGVADIKKVP
jgi:hypothetical protein